ncbi:MAG: hypothetical protein AAGC81_02460 [Pseudomonadota bacterium]
MIDHCLSERLRRFMTDKPFISDIGIPTSEMMKKAADEIDRLNDIINSPENSDFIKGVSIEAEHQVQRWGSDHDARKSGFDWFWTLGFLGQKAAAAFEAGDYEKAKHHCISSSALMKNMHIEASKRASARSNR